MLSLEEALAWEPEDLLCKELPEPECELEAWEPEDLLEWREWLSSVG